MDGQIISHYRIAEKLGAGGMGVVYKGEDIKLSRPVALKFLPLSALEDKNAIERFLREARTAANLNHPNICTIYEIGEFEGRHFIAMELLDGKPLDRLIEGKPLPMNQLLDLSIQIADGLDAAHAQGILHRDIKSPNIFVTTKGRAKVLDFGLAKLAPRRHGDESHDDGLTVAGHESLLTTQGVALGTVAYMSPEQARGEDLDARTDLFSFGVVLYEMATGQQTFAGSTSAVIFDAILNRMPTAPMELNAEVPLELERIISKALEKDRSMRYQTASDMRTDLQRLKRDRDSGRTRAFSSSTGVQPAPSGGWPSAAASQATKASGGVQAVTGSGGVPPTAGSSGSTAPPTATTPPAAPPVPGPPVAPPAAAKVAPLKPPAKPGAKKPAISATTGMLAAAAVLVLLMGIGAAVWLRGRASESAPSTEPGSQVASATESQPSPVSEPPVPLPNEATTGAATDAAAGAATAPAPPGSAIPAPTETQVPAANATPPPAQPAAPAKAAAKPATPRSASAAKTAASGAATAANRTPLNLPPSSPVKDAPNEAPPPVDPAVEAMSLAKAKLDNKLYDQALGDLQGILRQYPSSPLVPETYMTIASVYQRQNRPEDAMATYVELHNRFRSSARAPEAMFRLAELTLQSKRKDKNQAARATLGDLVNQYPDSPWAARALLTKSGIEERERIRETDSVLGGTVPAALVSTRTLVERYPNSDATEEALWKLGEMYDDLKRYDLEAAALEDLGARFPKTRHEVWWRLGELYEKRIKDRDKAIAAYSKIPASSNRYRDAQRRIAK